MFYVYKKIIFLILAILSILVLGCSNEEDLSSLTADGVSSKNKDLCASESKLDAEFERLMDEGRFFDAESLMDICESQNSDAVAEKVESFNFVKNPPDGF